VNEEGGDHVAEEHEGEPFEDAGDVPVVGEEQEGDDHKGEHWRPELRAHVADHLHRLRHAREVGADVDDVRN
jgi:hypothetical protein